jgi:hypothetical protein
VRIAFTVVILVNAAALGALLTVASDDDAGSIAPETISPRENTTVVTSQNPVGKIVAYKPNGEKLYVNKTYDTYFDVDPHPRGKDTVVYTATNRESVNRSHCVDPCVRSVIEVLNLSTGEVDRLISRYEHRPHGSEWHDVDRVAPGEYLVADMADNGVYRVDTDTGEISWAWHAQSHFDIDSGGPHPGDWTHLNDVEKLDDGRIMASMRNHDQVVFLDPETHTVIDNWTLGADGRHNILHEQHNPDYIPVESGGPAIVVADSENQRVAEYQRVGDEWERTWAWRDAQLTWPRDADRLPSGHTLIVDSHGNRVVEVGVDGDVVWTLPIRSPYDAERIETGDESTGGPSARRAGLTTRGLDVQSSGGNTEQSLQVQIWMEIRSLLPSKLVNGFLFVLPPWIGVNEMVFILGAVGTAGLWTVTEVWLAGLSLRSPVVRTRGEE